jgi:hypothetical protein
LLYIKKISFVFLLTNAISFAQLTSDTISFNFFYIPLNLFTTQFDTQLNIYNSIDELHYLGDTKDFFYKIDENYNSTVVISTDKSIKDAQYLSLYGGYKFSPLFDLGISVKNSILSDSRKIQINSASISDLVLFGRYNYNENIYISPAFGAENNRQVGVSDNGYVYGIEGLMNNQKFTDFEIYSFLRFFNEDISPRKNTDRNLKFSIKNDIDQGVSNQLSFTFIQFRRDFYYTADSITAADFDIVNNIQSRTETSYQVNEFINFENLFDDNITFNASGTLYWRNILRNTRYKSLNITSASIFDSEVNEDKFDLESNLLYKSDIFSGGIKAVYSERDEMHEAIYLAGVNQIFFDERQLLEAQYNNLSYRTTISIFSDLKLTDNDMISFKALQSKFRYDTPSANNDDDRDELLSILKLQYTRKINPFFEAFISTEGNFSKIDYIFASRSSDNNNNWVLKLTSGGNYEGKNLSSFNSFNVSANYTVYEFEDINPNYKSYSFRQFGFTDSSSYRFTSRISLKLHTYLKLSEQGELRWEEFTIAPTRYLEESFFLPSIEYKFSNLTMALGIRYFALKTYTYTNSVKTPESFYSSIGPTTEINIKIINQASLSLSGWYEFINIHENDNKTENANLNMVVNWYF